LNDEDGFLELFAVNPDTVHWIDTDSPILAQNCSWKTEISRTSSQSRLGEIEKLLDIVVSPCAHVIE
jgi:hypothetical protein